MGGLFGPIYKNENNCINQYLILIIKVVYAYWITFTIISASNNGYWFHHLVPYRDSPGMIIVILIKLKQISISSTFIMGHEHKDYFQPSQSGN